MFERPSNNWGMDGLKSPLMEKKFSEMFYFQSQSGFGVTCFVKTTTMKSSEMLAEYDAQVKIIIKKFAKRIPSEEISAKLGLYLDHFLYQNQKNPLLGTRPQVLIDLL